MWVRGLKPHQEQVPSDTLPVASYVGAWIETHSPWLPYAY